jgi:hypothetical protein
MTDKYDQVMNAVDNLYLSIRQLKINAGTNVDLAHSYATGYTMSALISMIINNNHISQQAIDDLVTDLTERTNKFNQKGTQC